MLNIFVNFYETLVFLIVLSILIIVHEWGHFITAKKLGVDVQRFAIGFGPTLFSKIYKGTEFAICLFPLGGYVKMAGDEKDECTGAKTEFYSQPPGKRALIISNGAVVNYIFAYIVLAVVFMLGHPGESTKISDILENSPAQKAGVMIGDRITGFDNKKVYGWNNFLSRLEGDSAKPINLEIIRNEQKINVQVVPDIVEKKDLLGQKVFFRELGIDNISSEVSDVVPGYPAEEAGIKAGDIVIAVDGVAVKGWKQLQKNIDESIEAKIALTIKRGEEIIEANIAPKITKIKDEKGNEKELRKIGIVPKYEFDSFRFGPIASFYYAFDELGYITKMTYKTIGKLVTGSRTARESVAGPVGIFYIIKGATKEGFAHLLFIVGIVSASLAIFNMLPVIPLDGGHLFLLGLEKLRGKPVSDKTDEVLGKIGFGLIILLAVFVFYADFLRFGIIDKILGLFVK